MDRNIHIEIRDRIAHLVGKPKIICGNNDYTVTFTFDDEWAGVEVKTLRVSYNNKYSDHVFTGDTVELPPIIKAVEVYLGVFAGDITSTKVAVRAEPSILCEGGSVADPEPDVYNQIIDLLNSREPSDNPGGSGGITQETDPTVPEWAKQPEKPKYTADEVGAQPKGDYALKSEIPSVPVQSVNGKTGAVQLTAADVNAQPKGNYALKSEIPSPYTLPTASEDTKGGVMIDPKQFTIDNKGVLGLVPDGDLVLIEEITIGFELLTIKPEDWETNWKNYYKNIGSKIKPVYEQIADASCPAWEEYVYFQYTGAGAAILRTEEPDGTPYNFKAFVIKVSKEKSVAYPEKIAYVYCGDLALTTYIQASTSNTTHQMIFVNKISGYWMVSRVNWGTDTSLNTLTIASGQYFARMAEHNISQYKTYSELPANTKIEFWGVRA